MMSVLYDICNILPLPLVMLMLFGSYIGIPADNVIVYGECLAVSVWMLLLKSADKKAGLRSIGVVAVFVSGLALMAGEENRRLFIEGYSWVLITAGVSAAAVLAGIVMMKDIWLRRAGAAALFVYSVISAYFGWKVNKAAFALICFYLLVRMSDEIQLVWVKSGYTDIREHTARVSPFLFAACLIVYLSPAPAKPYDWQLAKNICSLVVSGVNRIYGDLTHLRDDYGNMGFSDSGSFLSGLEKKDEDVLNISTDNRNIHQLKLVGCISGDFVNCEWVFDGDSEYQSRMTDTIETYCAVTKFDASYRSDYIGKADIECESLFYNTRYIFAPSKIRLENTIGKNLDARKRDIDIKVKDLEIADRNGSIVTGKKLRFSDKYIVSCYVINHDNPYLADLLRYASPIDENEWIQAAKNESASDECPYEDYIEYRRDIYNRFCTRRGVSEQTRRVLDEISEGADRYEACRRLEEYLSRMEYSTDCGALPREVRDAQSFLDYFLFTSKKGYCMHFATAFVLMANEMGIPCRYVQGYVVDRGNTVVRQSNAHAWPEVYFDNVGWIAFEPTPGYNAPTGWAVSERKEEVYIRPENTPAPVMPDEPEETVPEKKFDPMMIVIPILGVISFLIVFYIISRYVSARIYRKMGRSDRLRYLSQQNLRLMGILGFRMEEGETLAELMHRIDVSDRQDIKEQTGFIPIYEALLYSDREMTEEDIALTERINTALKGLVKKARPVYGLIHNT